MHVEPAERGNNSLCEVAARLILAGKNQSGLVLLKPRTKRKRITSFSKKQFMRNAMGWRTQATEPTQGRIRRKSEFKTPQK